MHIEKEVNAHNLNEKYLFHGTSSDSLEKICREGFDMRVPVKNGAAYGQGTSKLCIHLLKLKTV